MPPTLEWVLLFVARSPPVGRNATIDCALDHLEPGQNFSDVRDGGFAIEHYLDRTWDQLFIPVAILGVVANWGCGHERRNVVGGPPRDRA